MPSVWMKVQLFTHCNGVVHFISHIVRNQQKLIFSDVLDWTNYMRFALFRPTGATALWRWTHLKKYDVYLLQIFHISAIESALLNKNKSINILLTSLNFIPNTNATRFVWVNKKSTIICKHQPLQASK